MPATSTPPTSTPLGDVARLIDGGDMDCGSGLLLLITRAMRRLEAGDLLAIRSAEPSVEVDLPVWAELVGHEIADRLAETDSGPWWFSVRKDGASAPDAGTVFSIGDRTPVGHRLWAYTNFDCNLACLYCCAESSPKAAARRLDPDVVGPLFAQFREQGGKELLLTGGEPFMHPQLGELVDAAEGLERTILTNAMVFHRGRRRELLESIDRSVVMQVSLDSATPEIHDKMRGAGSWARALDGIGLAHSLGFRVKIAATRFDEDPEGVRELHERLDAEGIAKEDRVIRPVAAEGFADGGIHVSIDSLEPEPVITADGAWWHPVAVTNPHMRIADAPLDLEEIFGVVRDTLKVQDAASAAGREVFRCA
ncbi:radical SAM protein [Nocardioides sp.]|uniref:radical SAM protein n=1 Tax=Nocardioides sp. TaxID=35761 RepID=UPI002B26B459|nr:radical SAM protein [Nocardioides sp.]